MRIGVEIAKLAHDDQRPVIEVGGGNREDLL
jgi:hypothetical protein